ncbi:hypothetical protein R5R35_014487 [Gryllus longicercus]|uniref:DRBM domain-containing protein n=1 Tax=Gryllus longicercus TaxID=2509291 RepID=A0AAN9Z6W1_9ORTH
MWSLLTEIDIGNSGDYTPTVQSNNLVSEVQVISQSPDNVLRHPVTLLHQICSDLKWPSPTYVVISEDVTATRHVFTLECKVLKHKASGVGLSKRKAKRSASMALLEKLNDNEDLGKYAEIIYSHMYIFDKESETECPSEDGGAGNATSELYKMCYARRWPLPVYGLLSMEGPVHNRLYRIGCTMPGFQELDEASHYFAAEGKGHTKKEAKHAASVALLDKILGDMSSNPTSSCTTNSFEDRGKECESSQKYKISKNATSLLNELCMSYNWSLPVYEYLPESGSGTLKLFTVGCSLLGHTELGTGYTKKEAKHAASTALLLKIREYLEDSLPVFNLKENPSRE